MRAQVIDVDYISSKETNVVRLYCKNEAGESICLSVPGFEPYFYARNSNNVNPTTLKRKFYQIKKIEDVERYLPLGYQREPSKLLKITVQHPKQVPEIRDEVKELVGEVFETDILFKNRYLVDKNIKGMGWINLHPSIADYTGQDATDHKSKSNCKFNILGHAEPVNYLANASFKFLSLDIECLPPEDGMPEPSKDPVIIISLAFDPPFNGKKSIVLTAKSASLQSQPEQTEPLNTTEMLGNEVKMLNRFSNIVKEYDPDFIAGYNSNSFDFPYLIDRTAALEINLPLGRDDRGSVYYKNFGIITKVTITGRVAADALPLIKREFSLKQYPLEFTAKQLLNDEKLDMKPEEMRRIWLSANESIAKLVEYSRKDAQLALAFFLKLKLLDKYIALSRTSGMLLQDIIDSGQSQMIEMLLLRAFLLEKRVMPPKPELEEDAATDANDETDSKDDDGEEELKGGEVLPPKKGLLENIVILDYKSLYPTIMIAHNLCYTTQIMDNDPVIASIDQKDIIITPSGARFVSPSVKKGILPQILENLLSKRDEAKKAMKAASTDDEKRILDALQYALKILLNSFYGYSGYRRARIFSLEIANSVTGYGRENLLRTKDVILNEIKTIPYKDFVIPLSVAYGDTDSTFVMLLDFANLTIEDAEIIGKSITAKINERLPKPMELQYESFAKRAVFMAKKRYAIWVFEKSDEGWKDKIKVKGMETVRRDWCDLTSKTLSRCLEIVLKEGNMEKAKNLVTSTIDALRKFDYSDKSMLKDLFLTKKLSKRNYKSKQPHLIVAEKIFRRSGTRLHIGDRIPFVIISAKGKLFADKAEDPDYAVEHKLKLDTDYYVDKQILPPIKRLFDGIEIEIKDLKADKANRTLFEFHGDEIVVSEPILRPAKSSPNNEQKNLFSFGN